MLNLNLISKTDGSKLDCSAHNVLREPMSKDLLLGIMANAKRQPSISTNIFAIDCVIWKEDIMSSIQSCGTPDSMTRKTVNIQNVDDAPESEKGDRGLG